MKGKQLKHVGEGTQTKTHDQKGRGSSAEKPHGQDFGFSVEMKGNDTDSLLQEIEEYYEGFDPDNESCLWIGKNGAPYRIKDIVNDMEQAEAMIEKLYETLKMTMQ